MLAGELTVIVGGKETVLKANDTCYIGPNESREIINRGNEVCTIAGRGRAAAEVMLQAVIPFACAGSSHGLQTQRAKSGRRAQA